MRAAMMMKRIAEVSPRFKARMAGVLFLSLVLTSTFTDVLRSRRVEFRSAHRSGRYRGLVHGRCDAALLLHL